MNRKPQSKRLAKQRVRKEARTGQPMSWLALETLRLTAAAFRRCNFSPSQLADRFRTFVGDPRRPITASKLLPRIQLHDPGHLLTLWATDPRYVDANGEPRPLAMRGPAPSLEALVRAMRLRLELKEAVRLLIEAGAIHKVGRRYVPMGGDFVHHAPSATQSTHHLLVLHQMLRNFDFNSQVSPGKVTWPQRVVECPDFPAAELPALIADLDRRISSFTGAEDKTMSRIARRAPAGAPRVRAVVNLFVAVMEPSGPRRRTHPTQSREGDSKRVTSTSWAARSRGDGE